MTIDRHLNLTNIQHKGDMESGRFFAHCSSVVKNGSVRDKDTELDIGIRGFRLGGDAGSCANLLYQ